MSKIDGTIILSYVPLPLLLDDIFPAYIDPGAGSIIIQLLIGSVIGFLYFFKAYLVKALSFLKKVFLRKNGDGTKAK